MNTKMEHFPEKNPNPVLSISNDGTVLYSNKAGEPLLHEWGVRVGQKLPLGIGDFVQRVIARNSPEKLEVKAGNRIYSVAFHPIPEEECVNIYGFDISDHKEFEKEIQKSEALEVENIELEDIFDIPAIQSLIDDLYKLTHITIGLVDLKGKVSVIAGQQEICLKFHRVHPETCKQCIESDTKLSLGVAPTELKMYKCKNNMWDVATPLIVEGQHIGNIISGQFFFEDEPIDYELFRSQARKYGFNEEEYLAALVKVPRLSREAVNKNMSFFMKLANMLSQLSHSNFKLAKSLSERETLLETLRKSESKYLQIMETAQEGVWIIDRNDRTVFVNQRFSEMLGYSIEEIIGQTPQKFLSSEFRTVADDRLRELRQRVRQAIDYRFIRKDGSDLWCIVSTHQLFDDEGKYAGSLGMLTDITERKKAEEELQKSENRFRVMFEGHGAPMLLIEPNSGQIIDANEAAARFYEYSREQLRAMCIDQINQLPPEEVAAERHRAVDRSKNVFVFSHRLASGEVRLVEVYSSPVTIQGRSLLFSIIHDITERKQAEEKVKDASNMLQLIMNNIPQGIFWKDRNSRYMGCNKVFAKAAGVESPENIVGKTDYDLPWLCEQTKWYLEYDRRIMDNDIPEYHIVEPQRKADGELAWVETNKIPLHDAKGNVIGILGTYEDITERKLAEETLRRANERLQAQSEELQAQNEELQAQSEELQVANESLAESEARFRTMAENLDKLVEERTAELENAYNSLKESEERLAEAQKIAHIGSWERNLVTGDLYWSDEMYRIFGRNPQEGAPDYNALLNYMHPDDRDSIEKTIKRALNGESYSTDHRIISHDGEECTVHVQAEIVFDEKNTPVRIRGTVQDITERKKAEEQIQNLANIVESSNDAIGTMSLDGIITNWNKEAEKIYGYSVKEILGKSISTLAPPHLDKETIKLIEKVKQGKRIQHYETTRLRKDGRVIYVSFTLSPVFDIHGKLTAVSFISRDITKRKEAEEALAKIEIARKQEIHHRIKNNLQVISSLLDLQAEKFKNGECNKDCPMGCIKNSEVLDAFMESQNRVMSMALIHEELHKGGGFETLDFSPYIKELVESLLRTYTIGKTDVSLKLDLVEDAFFDMDIGVPLGIIINELVSNSFKHAFIGRDKGEIRIKLHREENGECKTEDSNSTAYVLSISDNGIGIPESLEIEDLETLGMQLVTTLVDQLDGELELKRDNGTEFTVRFTVTEKQESSIASIPTIN